MHETRAVGSAAAPGLAARSRRGRPSPGARPSLPALIAGTVLVALASSGSGRASSEGPVRSDWRPAPLYGADVRSVAIDPDDPDLLVAGTSAGQVYVSRDGGGSWRDGGDGVALAGWVVSDLLFDGGRLRAALWGVWGGGTVVASDDLGRSWKPSGDGLPGEQVYTLARGRRPGRLYAGTRSGVYGSTDGGGSWRPLTGALPEVEKVTSLLVEDGAADAPDAVIAGTWRRAYRSDDGGVTWRGLFEGMALDSEVFSLQPVPGRPGEIWASTCGWVYHTRDGGGRWARYQEGLDSRRTPSFAVLSSGRLLAGTVDGLYASDDGGASWNLRTDRDLAVLDIAVRDARVVLATEGSGVWISDDGAATFRRSALGMTNLRVGALVHAGAEVLVAVNHAGPASGVYTSRDGGATFGPPEARLPTVLSLAVAGYRVFAGTERGLFERSGVEWRPVTELGSRRVEQVATAGDRVVVRTPDALFELSGGRFVPTPYRHGPPRSTAIFDQALWVSDAAALYRLADGANHTVSAPAAGGRLAPLGERLALWGGGGVWTLGRGESDWRELLRGEVEVRPTGDPRFPALLIGAGGVFLAGPGAGGLHPVTLPVPAREVTAALVVGGHLLVGTSGYGLLLADLAPPADTASGSSSAATAGSGAGRSSSR